MTTCVDPLRRRVPSEVRGADCPIGYGNATALQLPLKFLSSIAGDDRCKVQLMVRWPRGPYGSAWMTCVALVALSCGEHGPLPTTVDPGGDFAVDDVVFDEGYFYCQVEPVLFRRGCGSGDPAAGDGSGNCHFNVTSYRLSDYSPLVADQCMGNVPSPGSVVEEARQNYQASQARMKLDPEVAQLLTRPTGQAAHPRTIFASDSEDANVIRDWATQFASQ